MLGSVANELCVDMAGKYASVELWQKKSGPMAGESVAVKVFNKARRTKKEIYDVIAEFLLMRKVLVSARPRESGPEDHLAPGQPEGQEPWPLPPEHCGDV